MLAMKKLFQSVLMLNFLTLAIHAHALNILLVNDDGFSSNIKATYTALVAAGHDVIVSVPCTNQSGKGASINVLTPITPLTAACRNSAAASGAAGVGAISGYTNFYYVSGTPVMATLYGLDVLAAARWSSGAPDLVISGPNEGANAGRMVVITSGTVSNAQVAMSRGLPAVAISAGTNTSDNDTLAAEVAALTVRFVTSLKTAAGTGSLMPSGTGLNVNIPSFTTGNSTSLTWGFSRIGTYAGYTWKFVSDLSQDATAVAYGLGSYAYPGVSVSTNSTSATTAQAEDEVVVSASKISVSAMQMAYEPRVPTQQWLRLRLKSLFGN
jgi:5'-nucleotidase